MRTPAVLSVLGEDRVGFLTGSIKLSSPATREFWEIPVVYEDEHLLAVNKPSGLLSSPDRCDPQRPNLMRLLHDGIAQSKSWAVERKLAYLMNAHRLEFGMLHSERGGRSQHQHEGVGEGAARSQRAARARVDAPATPRRSPGFPILTSSRTSQSSVIRLAAQR